MNGYVMNYRRFYLNCLIVSLLCVLTATSVWAHGADESVIQLQDVHLGPYRLTVMTAPRAILVGSLHVVVMVKDALAPRPRVILHMTVEAIPLTGAGRRQTSAAIPFISPFGSHEAQLDLTQPGRYQIIVHVPGTIQTMTFEVEVVSGVWMQGIILALFALTVVVTGWLVKEGFIIWRWHPNQGRYHPAS